MITRTIESAIVTGPTGAMGVALCQRLLDAGCEVYAVSRPDSARIGALPKHEKLHLVLCDMSELEHLPEQIERSCDAFFHLAWHYVAGPSRKEVLSKTGILREMGRNDMPMQISNIMDTIWAVHAAADLDCKVFIGGGSQAEYGSAGGILHEDTPCFPKNGYGMAKLCAGQMSRIECQSLGIAHIWPRVLSIYGPHDGDRTMMTTTIRKLLRGEIPALTPGEQKWDFMFSEDLADAFYQMALHGRDGAAYPVGSGEAIPLREYITILRDAIDPSLPLGFGQVAYSPVQVMHLQADITELQRDTGFVPRTAFADGIRKTIEWVKDEYRG